VAFTALSFTSLGGGGLHPGILLLPYKNACKRRRGEKVVRQSKEGMGLVIYLRRFLACRGRFIQSREGVLLFGSVCRSLI
jgi:hypothetical protein